MSRPWLLIDADDTLWENNVYFEEAFEEFVDFLDHSRLTSAEVREVLDRIEIENIRTHGYGSANFGRNMRQCFQEMAERDHDERHLLEVERIAERIMERPIELLDGVAETLEYLAERRRLRLFSKGQTSEQLDKFERSGLKPYFEDWTIVHEKDPAAYRNVVEESGCDPDQTWMVGNSPKSDVHSALEAGLRAVLIPHANTWSLEIRELPQPSERFRIVESFAGLRQVF